MNWEIRKDPEEKLQRTLQENLKALKRLEVQRIKSEKKKKSKSVLKYKK